MTQYLFSIYKYLPRYINILPRLRLLIGVCRTRVKTKGGQEDISRMPYIGCPNKNKYLKGVKKR